MLHHDTIKKEWCVNMKYCMIEIAFDNEEETMLVVNELLKRKLVCGCQVIESNSKWRWKNQIEMCKEYLLLTKTKKNLVKQVYELIKEIHSYECFEFAVFNLESCNKDYLNWIEESTI